MYPRSYKFIDLIIGAIEQHAGQIPVLFEVRRLATLLRGIWFRLTGCGLDDFSFR
jgi:hypothetical protein